MASWFTGEKSLSKFAGDMASLGTGLKDFATEVDGINPENVTAAANAAKSIAEMANVVPKSGGIAAWFSGDNSLAKFAGEFPKLGSGLKGFSDSVDGLEPENVTAAANAAKTIASVASQAESGAKAISSLTDALNNASTIKSSSVDGFAKALANVAKTSVDSVIKAFADSEGDLLSAGKNAIATMVKGAESKTKAAITAFKGITDSCAKALDKADDFETAGKNFGQGLVNGINAKQTAVYNAAYALGQKAVQGEKDGQKSNSPSKLTIQAGKWFGEGLVIGIRKMDTQVYNAGHSLGETATRSMSSAVSRVADAINTDIDAQPTIRPVLDLSDVRAGANSINGMFGNRTMSIDTRTVMATAAAMSGYQNGGNSDVVSAIKGLRKDISNMPRNSYSVGNVTYDDGSQVADAVQALVRAARVERRS